MTSGGQNGTNYLKVDGSTRTVFDDNVKDTLKGASGLDWLFYNYEQSGVKDEVTGNTSGDIKSDLD